VSPTPADIRSVHDQVSRNGYVRHYSYIELNAYLTFNFVKLLVKLCAERAPKRPFGSAYSIDNKGAPCVTHRLLIEGLDRAEAEHPPVDLLKPYEASEMKSHSVDPRIGNVPTGLQESDDVRGKSEDTIIFSCVGAVVGNIAYYPHILLIFQD
jgi:hypothetical protein